MGNSGLTKREEFITKIEQNNELLALPDAVAEIVELASEDKISIEMLSKIISRDTALTGRLLKIANSPFYGLSNRISNIQQAIMVLGMTTVTCLALSAALFDPRKISDDIDIDIKGLYGNVISIAITCRKLAIVCGYEAPEEAFTCGLLHDIGFLYFMNECPTEYKKVLDEVQISGCLTEEEEKAFGLSHTEAGRLIARKWRLPQNIVSAIGNHDNPGDRDSEKLDDIVRLAVALNREIVISAGGEYVEQKIIKISTISNRLGISDEHLDDISLTVMKDALDFAELIEIDIGDFVSILTRANKEIFSTYMSIQKLFKERRELTNHILEEERECGILEAKQVAISTLSHYINNASMLVSGQSQVLRMSLKNKNPEEIAADLPGHIDTIDRAIQKIGIVLEEISEVNLGDDLQYFKKSKIIDIDKQIERRLASVEQKT